MRRSLTALTLSTSLICSPLAAQTTPAEPALRELIPDEAVADPETWAQQGVPPEEAAAAEQAPNELAPDSPPAEVPEIDIPWPDEVDLSQITPLEPEEDLGFAAATAFVLDTPQVEMGGEERISDELVLVFPSELALFPHRDEFLTRFRALSTIEELDDDDNSARLAAQARADEELLHRLLRIYGYFDALVYRSVGGIQPGEESVTQGADALRVPSSAERGG
jgi:translocation and assembly module TamA